MKIKLVGQHVTVTSSITRQDIENAAKFAPKATKVYDEKGNELYRVSLGDSPQLTAKGANFNGFDAEGNLTVSFTNVMIPNEDRIEKFKMEYGVALASLQQYEGAIKAQITDAVDTVDAAFADAEIE